MNTKLISKIPSRIIRLIGMIVVIIITIIGTIFVYQNITNQEVNPLPLEIHKSLNFSPLLISKNTKGYETVDYKYSAVEDGTKILSYIVNLENDIAVSVSQYVQPSQFEEIPEYKDRFLSNIAKQYDTIQTSNGIIYLGRQTLQNNKQLGLMIEKGLLILMSPGSDLDSNQWRKLGDQFYIQKDIDN